MTQEKFEQQAREAAKAMLKKKAPTRPETQFIKGAMWAWVLLKGVKDITFFEEVLRNDIQNRMGEVEQWQESLITETAQKMVRLQTMEAVVEDEGYLLEKYDKNLNAYKESNPLLVHIKELDRTIGMQREHLGLSYKVNPKRITEPAKKGIDTEHDGLSNLLSEANRNMNGEIPEI